MSLLYLGWHEAFVALRTAAVTDRQARTAVAQGATYRGVDVENNPVLAHGEHLIKRYEQEWKSTSPVNMGNSRRRSQKCA
jgi:hypothetical protein